MGLYFDEIAKMRNGLILTNDEPEHNQDLNLAVFITKHFSTFKEEVKEYCTNKEIVHLDMKYKINDVIFTPDGITFRYYYDGDNGIIKVTQL